jgi:hypothetical protein
MSLPKRLVGVFTSLLFSCLAFVSVATMPTPVQANTALMSNHGQVLSSIRIDQVGRGYAIVKVVRTFSGQVKLFGDFFNPRGSAIRRDVEIGATTTPGNQLAVIGGSLVNGGYAIAWRNDHPSTNGGIRYSVLTTEGAYVARDFKANISHSVDLQPTSLMRLSNGSFVINWRNLRNGSNWRRSFTAQGVATSGEQRS